MSIFTDGSKTSQGVGYSWALTENDHVLEQEYGRLNYESSVFLAELTAIQQSLIYLDSYRSFYNRCNINIYSDSQSVIKAIYSSTVTHPQVLRVIGLLAKLPKVSVHWVKGHADVTGNEYADHLAKEGTTRNRVDINLPVPRSLLNQNIKSHYTEVWEQQWSNLTYAKHTKEMININKEGPKMFTSGNWTKMRLNRLIQFITGHSLLSYHLNKWYEISTTCPLYEEGVETPLHLWSDCWALTDERRCAHLVLQKEQQLNQEHQTMEQEEATPPSFQSIINAIDHFANTNKVLSLLEHNPTDTD